ncbi:MAG: translation elongation factor Ts [Aestuariivita sp.]|nr:translation elongation factor Ts [Aestuariivita sp.]
MEIKASQVKELRDTTGAGMMDAKQALVETQGDKEAAIDWLRTKGLAKAAKKSDRLAAEGLVCVLADGDRGVAVEVNTETDFVARNSEFQDLVSGVSRLAFDAETVEDLLEMSMHGRTVAGVLSDKIATIGENISIRRMSKLQGSMIASYVHNPVNAVMGKIGVLVAISEVDEEFGKQVAMHVAASNPAGLSEADLDPVIVEREKQVQLEIARQSGKPEAVVEKMIAGRMKKFVAESTLLNQSFVIAPDVTVAKAAEEKSVEVTGFIRLQVGDGLGSE